MLDNSTNTQTVDTIYGPIKQSLVTDLSKIKLLICDVDGVFSDGSIYLGNNNEEYKAFNTKDGYGVKAMAAIGVTVAVITGRNSKIVETRMASLGVQHLIQGRVDKDTAVNEIFSTTGFSLEQTMSIGDDIPDIGMFNNSLIGVAVGDAHPLVKTNARYVTRTNGGKGAVREVCDLLLHVHGQLDKQHGASL